eukprot:NODE_1499_length_884_cov_281.148503_g1160_i0.p1 GENE.NODE_1499_length_884_cov_281.148503_g1160_i0~~NODE_1499_length_884_cov_281.148503_g1160_i0.p1  ORF type:complete len:194 (+),score=18.50 NODE_1499_length_884_cov_281.148503_g1160_i0:67-648(+)
MGLSTVQQICIQPSNDDPRAGPLFDNVLAFRIRRKGDQQFELLAANSEEALLFTKEIPTSPRDFEIYLPGGSARGTVERGATGYLITDAEQQTKSEFRMWNGFPQGVTIEVAQPNKSTTTDLHFCYKDLPDRMPSRKNFSLKTEGGCSTLAVLVKKRKDELHLKVQWPMTPVQGFGIAVAYMVVSSSRVLYKH